MAKYKLNYSNDGYDSEGSYEIDVQANLIREFSTIVNAGIGQVLAHASLLLIQAEDGRLNPDNFAAMGLDVELGPKSKK